MKIEIRRHEMTVPAGDKGDELALAVSWRTSGGQWQSFRPRQGADVLIHMLPLVGETREVEVADNFSQLSEEEKSDALSHVL